LNIVVIGCGAVANERYLPEITASPTLRITAVYDTDSRWEAEAAR